MSMDDLMKAMGQAQDAPELKRIANAVELSAALDAHRFFKEQGMSGGALDKLAKVIQARASALCNGGK